jgi:hypothetical protein
MKQEKTFNDPTVNIAKFEKKLSGSGDKEAHEANPLHISKSGKRKRASPNDNAEYSLCAGNNTKGEMTEFGDDHTNNGHFADRFCLYHGYTGGHVSFKLADNGENECTVYHNNGTGRRYDSKHDHKLSQIVCAGDPGSTCDQSSLDNLNNNDAAFEAAFEAWSPGHCSSWNTGCTSDNNCAKWGSPFIHNSHINDNNGYVNGNGLCWKGSLVAACGQQPVDGNHRRLCPCTTV